MSKQSLSDVEMTYCMELEASQMCRVALYYIKKQIAKYYRRRMYLRFEEQIWRTRLLAVLERLPVSASQSVRQNVAAHIFKNVLDNALTAN